MKYEGTAVSMPAADGGFTVCCFDGKIVPVGTKLFSDDGTMQMLRGALLSIIAIEDKMQGDDWEEIHYAREIATQALERII